MSTQDERYTLATQPLFLRRVEMTIVQFARTVLAGDDSGAPGASVETRPLRTDLATAILADSAGYARRIAVGIVADPNITDQAPYGHEVSDGEIDGAVQYAWNAYAGIAT